VWRESSSFSPEVAALLPEFKPDLSPEDRLRVIEGLKACIEAYPELGADVLKRGLARLFERKLRRSFTEEEQRMFAERLETLGADRLGDVVLDLTPEQLAAWLADPDAR
jgi:hypothetical protein